ncbi:MAG: flagellar motor protein MotB [Verrucomicrobia bacterium]|nr:MAG: flagellar motor protein MotB [Verrucomicrobiota bacterium]
MKHRTVITLLGAATLALALGSAGCSTGRVTNQNQPGPQIGNAVGTAAGAVAGNVAGAAVGVVEGGARAAGSAFTPQPTRIIRHWREEKQPDGRTIHVPVDYLVDEHGRIIKEVPPGTAFR